MAVAKDKTRIKVTIHRDLADLIKQEADATGVSVSALTAKIIYDHYIKKGNYQRPKSWNQYRNYKLFTQI